MSATSAAGLKGMHLLDCPVCPGPALVLLFSFAVADLGHWCWTLKDHRAHVPHICTLPEVVRKGAGLEGMDLLGCPACPGPACDWVFRPLGPGFRPCKASGSPWDGLLGMLAGAGAE